MLNLKQRGITLIEVLLGLFVAGIITAGMVVFYSNTSQFSNETLSTVRLEYEMQTAMKLIKEDIRRAGFSAQASGLIGSGTVNPFMVTGTSDLSTPNVNCILLTYDFNMDGALPAINSGTSDERFAYRLSNQTIQSRPLVDDEFSCTANDWETLTNPTLIQITTLTFALTEDVEPIDASNPGGESIRVRDVIITMTGRLTAKNAVTRTITSRVRVRNDKYLP